MIQIKDLAITDQFGLNFLNVSFTISDTAEDISAYRFDLMRSDNTKEAFIIIGQNIKTFSFIDRSVNLYDGDRKYYYKVKITNTGTNEIYLSDISEFTTNEPDMWAFELIEVYNIYLETTIANEIVYLLKKKKSGNLCECYDNVRARAKTANCEICYGTKYIGGYYGLEQLKISYGNSPSKIERFSIDEVKSEESGVTAWTSNYPLLQIGDILIDKNNTRYVVSAWQPTYKNFYLLKQSIQLQRLPRSNVAYKVPVTLP